jgi:hypothetical protein
MADLRQEETMDAGKILKRAVFWANHGRGDTYVSELEAAGFEITRGRDAYENGIREPLEYWCWRDGALEGIVHEFEGEAFLFLYTPEARASRWRETLWRFTHPLTARKPHPARAREAADGVV